MSEPAVASTDLTFNLSIYALSSFVYLFLIYQFPNNLLLKIIFILVMLVVNVFLAWFLVKNLCKNKNRMYNFGTMFVKAALIWLVTFVPLFWLLENMYTWLEPFGNTFGYLVMRLAGVNAFIDNILINRDPNNSRISKYINYIRSDPWGFFSMLTTNSNADPDILNAAAAFDDLKLNNKLKPGMDTHENKTKFINFVRIKETVAKFIFYILTLVLMTDITSILVADGVPCMTNSEISIDNDDDDENQSSNDFFNKPETVYKSTE
jgi:hypothetical protein